MHPRPLPGVRALRTTLRTAHLVAFGALYGGHVYGVEAARLFWALAATLASGVTLMGLEMYRNPVWMIQVRGLATFAKILVVAAVALWWEARVWLLTLAIVIGGVVSHLPGRFRYYSIVHRQSIGEDERG
jgi:hypothetical protein